MYLLLEVTAGVTHHVQKNAEVREQRRIFGTVTAITTTYRLRDDARVAVDVGFESSTRKGDQGVDLGG